MTLADQDSREQLAVAVYGQDAPTCQLTEGLVNGPPCSEAATHRAIFDCQHDNFACARHAQQLLATTHVGLLCVGYGYKPAPLHAAQLIRVIPI